MNKLLLVGVICLARISIVCAAESLSPFIDTLNQELNENQKEKSVLHESHAISEEGSYTDQIRRQLEEKDAADPRGSFIEETKNANPKKFTLPPAEVEESSYLTQERAKLSPVKEDGAIEDFAKGRSKLHAKKKGNIHQSYGFRYGINPKRDITGNSDTVIRPFNEIYGNNYAPDVSFFYEYQFFHSELWGSLGLMGLGGVSYFSGKGQFPFSLSNPSGGEFSVNSNTKFQFFILPMTIAASYRFNLLYFLRPYIVFGPSLIGFVEMRNDEFSGNRGYSQGLFFSAGVSLLLDWISDSALWDLYTSQGVQHFYISLDYSRLSPLSGNVNFSISGLSLGLTFEF